LVKHKPTEQEVKHNVFLHVNVSCDYVITYRIFCDHKKNYFVAVS